MEPEDEEEEQENEEKEEQYEEVREGKEEAEDWEGLKEPPCSLTARSYRVLRANEINWGLKIRNMSPSAAIITTIGTPRLGT